MKMKTEAKLILKLHKIYEIEWNQSGLNVDNEEACETGKVDKIP